jgi:hypothetical protein
MVPPAAAADLHDMDGEVVVERCEAFELVPPACRTRRVPQRVAEDPRHERDALLAADRAGLLGGLAVKPRSLQQVRSGIADVRDRDPTGVDVREQRTALQRVVDHLSLGAHPRHSTRHPLWIVPTMPRSSAPDSA